MSKENSKFTDTIDTKIIEKISPNEIKKFGALAKHHLQTGVVKNLYIPE